MFFSAVIDDEAMVTEGASAGIGDDVAGRGTELLHPICVVGRVMDVSGEIHRAHFAELVLDELHGDFERRAVGDWRAGSRWIGGRRALGQYCAEFRFAGAGLFERCQRIGRGIELAGGCGNDMQNRSLRHS